MAGQDDQGELFSPDDNVPWDQRTRSIMPGDWLSIDHEGQTVVGMIYRCQEEAYTFVYWDGRILRFGTATPDCIGPRDEELTAQFRGQIAIIPDYVENCIAAWVMQPERPIRTRPDVTAWKSTKAEPPMVQLRLFPD